MAQHTGQVKWFNNAKGYGFVGCDGGPDVFCHFSSIQTGGYKTIREGDHVDFDIIEGEKGRPQTHKVRKLQSGVRPLSDTIRPEQLTVIFAYMTMKGFQAYARL